MYTSEASCLMSTTDRATPIMVRGAGSLVWDRDGREYLDFVQGWATNALGHAPPEIIAALTHQAQSLITASPAYYNEPQLALGRRLTSLSGLESAYLSCTGTEATETAIKLARRWGRLSRDGAYEIVSTRNGFHGRTLGAMTASGKPGWEELFPPNPPGFIKVEYGDVDAVAGAVSARTAAILVEPIQGEAGVVVPPKDYLVALRQLADTSGVLLMFDEVQTGLGRTGQLFAHEASGVKPDILTLGKGLGGGVPISATLASSRANCFVPGDHGGTFHGAPLACQVALAVLDVVSSGDFLHQVNLRGQQLATGLEMLVTKFDLVETRGAGLLRALVLRRPCAAAVRDRCLEFGLLVNAAREDVLRLMPSLRVTETEIASMLARLDAALAAAKSGAQS